MASRSPAIANLATAGPPMQDELHLSGTEFGALLSAFIWTYVPAQLLAAWLAERFGAYRVLAAGVGIWSLATAASGMVTGYAAFLLLRLGAPNLYAVGQTLAGPRAAGKWMAVQNSVGNLAGIVAPIVTGYVVDRTGQFVWAFLVAAAVGLVSVVAWGVIVGRVEPIAWDATNA